MASYQAEQARALAKERQHHIAAAARQLETLLAMEESDTGAKNQDLNNEAATKAVLKEEYMQPVENSPESEIAPELQLQWDAPNEEEGGKVVDEGLKSSSVDKISQQHVAASVLHYADMRLSTELNNILNGSALDPSPVIQIDETVRSNDREQNAPLQTQVRTTCILIHFSSFHFILPSHLSHDFLIPDSFLVHVTE